MAEPKMAESKFDLNEGKMKTEVKEQRPAAGLEFRRMFTDGKTSAFDEVEWDRRTALIGNEKGQTIFRQENVEVPKSWSQTATNIVVSKYFHGKPNTAERETSVRQLISRVANTIVNWGDKGGYFSSPGIARGVSRRTDPSARRAENELSIRRCGSTWACSPSRNARPASSIPSRTTWNRS